MFGKSRLFVGISLFALGLTGCGSDDSSKPNTPAASTVTWNDVKGTVSNKCGGASCHGSTASQTRFVDNETLMKSVANTSANRIRLTSGSSMMPPPDASTGALTGTEKTQLLSYLDAQ